MKIIGFCQIRNELQNGNLHNLLKGMEFCEKIYIFDQASDDGSHEVYAQHDNVVVIQSEVNRFVDDGPRRLASPKELIERNYPCIANILKDNPDADWLCWLDGDSVLEGRLLADNAQELKQQLRQCQDLGYKAMSLQGLNMWRSNRHCRVDNEYNDYRPVCFWRNTGQIVFADTPLRRHGQIMPVGMQEDYVFKNWNYYVLRYGHSTDEKIIRKYDEYKAAGQEGWLLDRILDERGIQIAKLYDVTLPDFIDSSHGCKPTGDYLRAREPVKTIYEELKKEPASPVVVTAPRPIVKNVEVVSLVYKSLEYLDFIYSQLMEYGKADGWNVGVRIIANDATDAVLSRLYELDIPFSVYNNPDPDAFYINRTWRAFNYAMQSSHYNNVCFVNSDMAFSEGWLDNLLKHHNGVNIPCSKLVNYPGIYSGLGSINNGVNKDFGGHPQNFRSTAFESYAKELAQDKTFREGWNMPCVFERARFLEAGKFPEGAMFNGNLVACDNATHPHQLEPGRWVPFYKPSDLFFFQNIMEQKYGMKHITVCDSIVYHVGEGEKNESAV